MVMYFFSVKLWVLVIVLFFRFNFIVTAPFHWEQADSASRISFSMEIDLSASAIEEGLRTGLYKRCPYCTIVSELVIGCNYVKCTLCIANGKSGEWCWQCGLPKYANNQIDGKFCNDPNHNSH